MKNNKYKVNKKKILEIIFKVILDKYKEEDFKSLNKNDYSILKRIFSKGRSENILLQYIYKNSIQDLFKSKDIYFLKNTSLDRSLNNLKIFNSSLKLFKILKRNNIKFKTLKGINLLNDFYLDISDRSIRDIDILIDKKDIRLVIDLLKEHKYLLKETFYLWT